VVWSFYSAAEPFGRRVWPTMFISSSRLLSPPTMQWRDPLIGQYILIGMIARGVDFPLRGPLNWTITGMVTGHPPFPMGPQPRRRIRRAVHQSDRPPPP